MVTSTPFTGSTEVYDWICSFINFERDRSKRSSAVDRMKVLVELAGNPERSAPSFHIAGSKGKGSVTGMIAAILEASGIKTARYSSPNVSDFRERVSMGKSFFDEQIYAIAGKKLKEIIDLHLHEIEEPDFFVLFTLWFFLCAQQAKCGAMSVETGMGGRLDSTNVLDPLVSVITIIELEHTEYLGKTIAAIAGEKAGIIKPGRPLILAEQRDEALEVFTEHATRKKSPLIYVPDNTGLENVRVDRGGTSFSLVVKNQAGSSQTSFRNLFIPIPGEVQAKNAALAILAVKTAYPDISEAAIREGLAGFTLPARFERISETPLLVIDGAHTERSVDLCIKTFSTLYGAGGILIFGCASKKDVLGMAKLCVPCFSRIIITRPGTFKQSHPEDIKAIFVQEAEKISSPPLINCIPETTEAVDMAVKLSLDYGLPILGAGSFYLAGEIRHRFIK